MAPLPQLVLIGLLAFLAVAAVRFARAGRIGHRLDPRRLAVNAAKSALLGAVVVTAGSAVLLAIHRADQGANGAGEASGLLLTLVAAVLVLPAATWAGLRLLGVRSAWLATLGAWALLGLVLVTVQPYVPGGRLQPAWFYGALALLPYAAAGVVADPAFGPAPAAAHQRT